MVQCEVLEAGRGADDSSNSVDWCVMSTEDSSVDDMPTDDSSADDSHGGRPGRFNGQDRASNRARRLGWDDDGTFNFEGGCYAKTINLSEETEPDIYRAIKRDATRSARAAAPRRARSRSFTPAPT